MEKKILNDKEISEIIKLYTIKDNSIGMANIGKKYGISRTVVKRILTENGIQVTNPGQKYKGGKTESDKRYRKKSIESGKYKEKYKEWYNKNKIHRDNWLKEWKEKNKEDLKEKKRIRQLNYLHDNPKYRLAQRIKTAIWQNIKDNGATKYKSTFDLLPYNFNELKNHLEKLFIDNMSWDNYGEWHVDHNIPQSRFTFKDVNDEEFIKCWSLSNLRPLWGKINISKKNSLTYLSFDAIRNSSEYIKPGEKLGYNDIILEKEYIKNIIEIYGVDYVESYIDDIINFLWKISPDLPNIETNENINELQHYFNNVEPLDNNNDIVNSKINHYGNMFLKKHFKSYWKSSYKNAKSPYDAWKSKTDMRILLKYRLGINNSGEFFDISLKEIVKGLSATRKTISFFKPLLACFLYKRYLGEKITPTVLDPCCGFGGRLVGFKTIYPYGTYIGCEPNVETYNELNDLIVKLGYDNVKIYNCKFEDLTIDFDYDLALTSIPYYNLEKYSKSVIYNSYEDWKDKFITPLLKLKNCVINLSKKLCDDLELNVYVDTNLINSKNHFNGKVNKEPIIKINFDV